MDRFSEAQHVQVSGFGVRWIVGDNASTTRTPEESEAGLLIEDFTQVVGVVEDTCAGVPRYFASKGTTDFVRRVGLRIPR